jgi:hypothetical protein
VVWAWVHGHQHRELVATDAGEHIVQQPVSFALLTTNMTDERLDRGTNDPRQRHEDDRRPPRAGQGTFRASHKTLQGVADSVPPLTAPPAVR